jgi:osmotically-inducible protein OsmY
VGKPGKAALAGDAFVPFQHCGMEEGIMMQLGFMPILMLALIMALSVTVPAPQVLAMSDEDIKQRIEGAATDTFRLKKTRVEVAVEDGYVVLYGVVDLYIQRMLYEQIAWKAEGVVEVENEIRVVPKLVPSADEDIKRKIMEIVHSHPRLQTINPNVRVEGGAVLIRGTFEHPRDVLFLKHQVAEIEGVITLSIMAKFLV